MASLADAEEALRSTNAKANFQRLTRLLMCGGLRLLRETFDSIHSPADLPLRLSDPIIQAQLRGARLSRPEWNCLYPSPGTYGKSTDCDITLLFRLLRTICNLTPPPGPRGWDNLPNSSDVSLEADLVRIKYYRNEVYGHKKTMKISDVEFVRLWTEIRESLLRIAATISHTKRDEWKTSIDKYLSDPLTPEEERYIEELNRWYMNDMDVKAEVQGLRDDAKAGVDKLDATVKEEVKTLKEDMKRGHESIHEEVRRLREEVRQSPAPVYITGPVQVTQIVVNNIESFTQAGILNDPYGRPQLPQTVGNPDQEQAMGAEGNSEELQLNQQDPPTEEDIWNVIYSFEESILLLVKYFRYKLNAFVRWCDVGSLLTTVECSTLKSLEGLWEDYCSGHLNEIVQEVLITTDVLEKLGLTDVKLKTFLSEEEYEKGKQIFMDNSEKMSGVVETPVAKYGRSSEFGDVLDFIQTMISNDTLRQAFNIPHLVMVGRQNMAKTTLINRLIGRYLLPMRRNEMANTLQARTTYPIILNLRNGEKSTVEVKCDKIPNIGGTVENPTDDVVENFLNQVTGHLPKEEGTPISKTPVNVTLTGPELTTLTLVDLPGAHFANDDPRMNHVTQTLVLEYIEKNTNSIIVIVSEVGDPTGDSAINLVMQKASDFRSRTICALTKPDKLRDSDDMGKRVAMNESSFTLEDNRFILLRGKDGTDPKEKDWDAEMTRIKEKEWFGRHPQYKDIQHVCGIDRLMDTMISLLAEKMITEIPILVRQMRERKTEVDRVLKELEDSEVPESSEGKGAVAMKLKHNLIKELNKLLFNNTSNMEEGGEKVRKLFNSFHEAVFKVDPLTLRNDDEIRRQQKKLEGAVAPLGQSSENSQLLQKLLYEEYTGYKPNGQAVRVQSPVDKLLPLSEKLVQNVEVTLREIVQKSIEHSLSKFPSLKQAVEAKVVSKIFETKRDQTIQFIRQFLEMQKESIDLVYAPVPTPREISLWEDYPMKEVGKSHPCMTSKTMSHMKDLAKKLYPETLVKEIETVSAHQIYGNYKELDEMKNIKKNVVRCFNVLKMNMCDTVPRCILHFFVTQLVDDLDRALEQENLVEFLLERKDIRDKRTICRKQSLALAEALPRTTNVLDKLLRMKQGTPVKGGKM